MHIIILGATPVGASLAASLVVEGHSVTVVDEDEELLHELQGQYDLRTIQGHCAHPSILAQAGAREAEMILAVTESDESNIVACFVAMKIFKIPLKIASVSSADYFINSHNFFAGELNPIDIFINPSSLITQSLYNLIEYTGALRIFDFCDDKVKLIATKPLSTSKLLGKTANELQNLLPNIHAKIIAIYRNNQLQPISTPIEINDDVLFVSEKNKVSNVLNILRPSHLHHSAKRIMIIGGGLIGSLAAKMLENQHQVKLIEKNPKRCEQLALQLKKTLVLRGNGCDTYLLRNEDVENLDCFCALTDSDADNIVSSLHSKQLGAKQVIALVNRDAYLSLIISGHIDIDIALSPQQITISAILSHLHRSNVIKAYSLRRGSAEALEIKVLPGSPILEQTPPLPFPNDVFLAAIMRQNHIIIPDINTLLQADDRVILFVADKKQMRSVELLFNVSSES